MNENELKLLAQCYEAALESPAMTPVEVMEEFIRIVRNSGYTIQPQPWLLGDGMYRKSREGQK